MGKGVKGHIALWTLGRYVDDPMLHDFLNTMSVYAIARHFGPGFVEGQPGLARYALKIVSAGFRGGLAPSIRYRVVSEPGEWPTRMEKVSKSVRPPVHSVGPVTAGSRMAAVRGSGALFFGTFVQMMKPSWDWFGEMALTSEDFPT